LLNSNDFQQFFSSVVVLKWTVFEKRGGKTYFTSIFVRTARVAPPWDRCPWMN